MVDRETVREGYDALADAYEAERGADEREVGIVRTFLDGLPADARLLDAGCGQGRPVLRRLESREGVGVDLSRAQLTGAAAAVPDAAFCQGDLTRLPVANGAVDAVTAFHSLIHVPRGEHQRAIDEFARVLRPGGHLLVSEGPQEWRGTNPDWLDAGAEMAWHIAGADATRDHLRSAGFTVAREWVAEDDMDEDGEWVFFAARLDGGDDQ